MTWDMSCETHHNWVSVINDITWYNNRYSRLRQLTHITQWFTEPSVFFSSVVFVTSHRPPPVEVVVRIIIVPFNDPLASLCPRNHLTFVPPGPVLVLVKHSVANSDSWTCSVTRLNFSCHLAPHRIVFFEVPVSFTPPSHQPPHTHTHKHKHTHTCIHTHTDTALSFRKTWWSTEVCTFAVLKESVEQLDKRLFSLHNLLQVYMYTRTYVFSYYYICVLIRRVLRSYRQASFFATQPPAGCQDCHFKRMCFMCL